MDPGKPKLISGADAAFDEGRNVLALAQIYDFYTRELRPTPPPEEVSRTMRMAYLALLAHHRTPRGRFGYFPEHIVPVAKTTALLVPTAYASHRGALGHDYPEDEPTLFGGVVERQHQVVRLIGGPQEEGIIRMLTNPPEADKSYEVYRAHVRAVLGHPGAAPVKIADFLANTGCLLEIDLDRSKRRARKYAPLFPGMIKAAAAYGDYGQEVSRRLGRIREEIEPLLR